MADSRGPSQVDAEAKRPDWPTRLVLIHASSVISWKFVSGKDIARDLHCTYLDYDDVSRSLATTCQGQGKLGNATDRVLTRVGTSQLSFGRSALIVGPRPSHQWRSHLDGLLRLVDFYGVPLVFIELIGTSEAKASEDWFTWNDIPILILPSDFPDVELTAVHYLLRYQIKRFVEYFDDVQELVGEGAQGMPDDIKLRHFAHRHPLLLKLSGDSEVAIANVYCSVCAGPIAGLDNYSCPNCCFFLHKSCAELPQHTMSPIHSHLLRLVTVPLEKNGHRLFCYSLRNPDFQIKCLVCVDRAEHGALYGCLLCPDLFVHHECICSLHQIMEHTLHPHPLKMQTMEFPQLGPEFVCYACGGKANAICYSCEECGFYLHMKCARDLPSSVYHQCHKDHPLILSVPPKDETNEYYCEVCAERRHPDYWIYYCKNCEYEAHPHCVIEGIPPYTYTEEEEDDNKNKEEETREVDYPGKGEDCDDNEEGGIPSLRKIMWKLVARNKKTKQWYGYI